MKSTTAPADLIGWIESLADETRLRLLRILERHELGVLELCDVLQLPQSTVSRHLKTLSGQRWLSSYRKATTNRYRLTLDELEPAPRQMWLIARQESDEWPSVAQDRLRLARLLQERRKDSRAFFADAASHWDRLREEVYGNRFTTAAMLALLPGDATIVDLGCGTGQMTASLAPFAGSVVGIDNSAAMLAAAAARTAGFDNVTLHTAELDDLPLPDKCCDAALLVLALSYVPEPPAVLDEATRILKPGGKLVLVDLLPHDREDFRREMDQFASGFSPQWTRAALIEAGLHQPSVRPLDPAPSAKGPALFLATAMRQ